MEPIWMNGKDMIKFEESQGDYCYFDKSLMELSIFTMMILLGKNLTGKNYL
ncbi:hypothetical protein LMB41_02515 [Limosilactobacillus reuteri]|uniref:hypothetical protein n=1 Tax=Limosilactobacillus reuteri TaxID=1598 RepID=UPI001E42C5A9|nr:hypothetical protein [Limosilactobacillus reuteri]MCC4389084.1 hypothetical protein [Limosilactobacillus reuteri]